MFEDGVLVTWSPFFNLSSPEAFNASKRLPFPTGKELNITNDETRRPVDVLSDDVSINKNDKFTTIYLTNGSYIYIPDNGAISTEFKSPLDRYILLRNYASTLNENDTFGIEVTEAEAKSIGIENGMYTGVVDIPSDFEDFNNSVLNDFVKSLDVRNLSEHIIAFAPNLDVLIRAYNELGYSPEVEDQTAINIVNTHNKYLRGGRKIKAAYNFVSIKSKDISKDPINQIQAQSGIDKQTDYIKDLLKPIYDSEGNLINGDFLRLVNAASTLDRGSIYSKFFTLTLTLAGKQNVGIVASSMKNFEACSYYIYDTLKHGTEEEQDNLVINKSINGHRIHMLANAYSKNIEKIKSERAREIVANMDQEHDQFLVLSALLSLATD